MPDPLPFRFVRSLVLVLCAAAYPAAAQQVVYVDVHATGPGQDGVTWCTAYRNLQDALAAANLGDAIRVAEGIYTPDRGTGDRTRNFPLIDGVALYGGYPGCGAANPDARDFLAFETILSGDLDGDDAGEFANRTDNSYHVVVYDDPNATGVVLDGFTVTAGHADGSGPAGTITNQGAAVHIREGNLKCIPGGPTLRNCTFRDNWSLHHAAVNDHALATVIDNCVIRGNFAGTQAGGLLIHSGSTTVTNTTFIDNETDGNGGGVWSSRDPTCIADASRPTFSGCEFTNNSAYIGAGFYAEQGSSPEFRNCTFNNNHASPYGGGLWVGTGSVKLVDCMFDGNEASSGGGIKTQIDANLELERCLFNNNLAGTSGAGLHIVDSSVVATDCVFDGNVADVYSGGGVWSLRSAGAFVGCTFRNNEAYYGGAVNRHGEQEFTFTDCVFKQNRADVGGGGFAISMGGARLTNCLFEGNTGNLGGAVNSGYDTSPEYVNCVFNGNMASVGSGHGGAMFNWDGSSPTLTGCTFSDNTAVYRAGAVFNRSTNLTITDCSFTGNTCDDGTGAIFNIASTLTILRSSFSGNSSTTGANTMGSFEASNVWCDHCTFERDPAEAGYGLVQMQASDVLLTNCVLADGAYCTLNAQLTLINTIVRSDGIVPGVRLFSGSGGRLNLINTVYSGNKDSVSINGGITVSVGSGPLAVINSTFSANEFTGGVISLMPETSATIYNSILWGGANETEAEQLFVASTATLDIRNSFVEGWTGILGGMGNSGTDPMFVDAAGCDGVAGTADDDVRLAGVSLGVDAGDRSLLPSDFADLDGDGDTSEPLPVDLAGNPRIVGAFVDMGAFEREHLDCNDNGIDDGTDLLAGTSQDCDGNDVPDECDSDSDGDGVPDGCDSCNGGDDTLDCNHNDYADPCEVLDGVAPDLDGNGIPDDCDIMPHTVGEGCRALGVTPAPTGEPMALRLTSQDFPCLDQFLAADGGLTDSPVFLTSDEWGLVIVAHEKIIPSTRYVVTAELAGGAVSAQSWVTTPPWGDVVGNGPGALPDGNVNFSDIGAVVNCFKETLTAPPLHRCDIWPAAPDGLVNFSDIGAAVEGFKSLPYPYAGPCP